MTSLPEPHFVDRDAAAIRAELIAEYEAKTGRPLIPSQFEAQIIELMAYREALARIAIQEAAKQNLVAYARFPMLDHLARLVGVGRLPAQPATTTIRFTLPAPLALPTPVPKGTRVRTKDGRVEFETADDVLIEAGDTTADVLATARALGSIGTGYPPGQVADLVDDLGVEIAASNVTETSGGAAQEDSDRLRERIPLAVRGLSVAGPEDAYRFHALSAHPDVADVAITTPEPGVVRLAVLSRTGVPTPDLLDAVEQAVSSRSVRPICDTVEVVAAQPVDYELEARLTLRRGALVDATMAAAEAAAQAYVAKLQQTLGRAPVLSQIVAALSEPSVAGVYAVELLAPSAVTVARDEWARCVALDVTFAGWEEAP